jgi:predicted permease
MILEKMLSVFIIMAIGFIAKKARAVDAAFTRSLSAFLLNIALPFAFVASLDRSIPKSALPELGIMLLWSVALHLASIGFSAVAYRRFPEGKRKVLSFATVFTNCAFMGLPVAQSIGGSKGLMLGAMYNIVYIVFIYTYGMSLFRAGTVLWRRALLNPGLIAILIGLVLWLLPFSLPSFALEAIGIMAKLQTPLAMFIVGANIAAIRIKEIRLSRELVTAIVVRLLVLPLAAYGATRALGAPGIALVMVAMPAGAQTVVVSEMLGGDSVFASEVVFTTTVLSVFTIPVFAALAA